MRTPNPFSKKLNQFYRKEFTLSIIASEIRNNKQYSMAKVNEFLINYQSFAISINLIDLLVCRNCNKSIYDEMTQMKDTEPILLEYINWKIYRSTRIEEINQASRECWIQFEEELRKNNVRLELTW